MKRKIRCDDCDGPECESCGGTQELSESEPIGDLNALLSCPFCGGKAVLDEIEPHTHMLDFMPDHKGSFTIECDSCSLGIIGENKERLIAHWNGRVETGDAVIDRLRGQLQNCVSHLERAKRQWSRGSDVYDKAIDSANRVLYETFPLELLVRLNGDRL